MERSSVLGLTDKPTDIHHCRWTEILHNVGAGLAWILWLVMIFMALDFAAKAQQNPSPSPSNTYTTLSTAPEGLNRLEVNELISTTSTKLCSTSTVDVTRASATQLSVATSAGTTTPEFIRWSGGGEATITTSSTTITLTGTTAADIGQIWIYARKNAIIGTGTSTYTLYARQSFPTATVTCAGTPGCTVETGQGFPSDGIALWTWKISSTPGQWDVSGGTDSAPNNTCWVDMIHLRNNSSGNVSVTVTTADSLLLPEVPTITLLPNQSVMYNFPGGIRLQGGALWAASANSAIYARARMGKIGK